MKSMKCDMCKVSFDAEAFDAWVEQMKPHYAGAHADLMQSSADLSKEQQMKKMSEWMDAARARFDAL
jgi:hypothetical protein